MSGDKTEVETPAPVAATSAVKEAAAPAGGEPVKSSPSKKESEISSSAMGYLSSGKRNLLVRDISGATSALEEACRLLGEHYGETAKECGEAYFYYGKSLLELARLEAGVIDNAFDGVNEDTEDEGDSTANNSQVEDPKDVPQDEKEKISEQVDDALIENCQETEEALLKKKEAEKKKKEEEMVEDKENVEPPKEVVEEKDGKKGEEPIKDDAKDGDKKDNKDDTESEEKSEEDEEEEEEEESGEKEKESDDSEEKKEDTEEKSEEKKETESIGSNEAGTSDVKDVDDKAAVEKEEEEDPSNLQLSWEMLELAKSIFSKHADSIADPACEKRNELESKLSETYQLLGEVSIENENYEQAVEDLTSCLRRRQELMPNDSRCIAETHYQLGVAYGFNLKFDEAVASLQSSIEVLESRIKNLKDKTESKDPSKKDDAFYTREKEVEEIEKLIPEIKEKIADTRDMQEETMKKIAEQTGFGAPPSKSDDKPASDVKATSSIMVKKRKKSVESAGDASSTENGSSAKKPHLETNGSKPEEKMET